VRIRGGRGMLFERVQSFCYAVAREWSCVLVIAKYRGRLSLPVADNAGRESGQRIPIDWKDVDVNSGSASVEAYCLRRYC
jgi:hypothetical protein